MAVVIHIGDCREIMAGMEANSVDAIVTDPPYELGFMGKSWDSAGVSFDPATWAECLRVLKPGGHLLAFGGTRTVHRIAVAIEDAGFTIRDQIAWMFGSGFPKSHNVGKALDASAGATREIIGHRRGVTKGTSGRYNWHTNPEDVGATMIADTIPATEDAKRYDGWGTALKPAYEPIIVARKPFAGTVAENVAMYGTGALNIDGCRIGSDPMPVKRSLGTIASQNLCMSGPNYHMELVGTVEGRWPANVVLDEVAGMMLDAQSGERGSALKREYENQLRDGGYTVAGPAKQQTGTVFGYYDTGGASRFFYCAKASRQERNAGLQGLPNHAIAYSNGAQSALSNGSETYGQPGAIGLDRVKYVQNHHPTVKPVSLMRWLVRMVCPPDGTVLDPFTGSGTTGIACAIEGFRFIGCEQSPEYAEIANRRIAHASGPLFYEFLPEEPESGPEDPDGSPDEPSPAQPNLF